MIRGSGNWIWRNGGKDVKKQVDVMQSREKEGEQKSEDTYGRQTYKVAFFMVF